jgi:hypothetical protein
MANPTTYFGWVMPTSSSLVTNLPADFNTFGQGVDTSLQDLLGGTTGQVLSKTSATNMDFTWVTPTDQTPLTTKGDLFTFSTVDARLGVGTNGQTLVADSTASTGLKWATPSSGALTLITTNTFSAQSSVSINNVFSSTYDNYRLLFTFDSASVNQTYNSIRLRASGSDTSTNYKTFRNYGYTGTVASGDLDPVGTDEWFISDNGTSFNGAGVVDMTIFSPNRAKYSVATVHSAYNWGSYTNATVSEWQTDSTQFDGFTILVNSGTITGNVSIYGYGK